MSFEIQDPIKGNDLHLGCLNCSTATIEADMDMVIAVGFGSAVATKDGKIVYDEQQVRDGNYLTVGDIELLAKEEPDCDWRIQKLGPMRGEIFQRQGDEKWVCIESNQGFA